MKQFKDILNKRKPCGGGVQTSFDVDSGVGANAQSNIDVQKALMQNTQPSDQNWMQARMKKAASAIAIEQTQTSTQTGVRSDSSSFNATARTDVRSDNSCLNPSTQTNVRSEHSSERFCFNTPARTNVRPASQKTPRAFYRAMAVALIFAVTCAILTASPFANYSSKSDYSDSARVAAFAVTASEADASASHAYTLDATNKTSTYSFTVSNTRDGSVVNEVATSYDVVLTLPSAMAGVTPTLTNGTSSIVGASSTDGTTYTFANAGKFEAGTAKTDNLTLTFTLDQTKATSGTWEGLSLQVKATQID